MSFISNALARLSGRAEQRNNPMESPAIPLAAGWQWLMGGQHSSDAGEVINERTSLEDATVFACCRIIAESIAGLNLRLLRLSANGRSVATDHPVYSLLAKNPNPECDANTFLETHVLSLALTGNGYAQIQRDKPTGRPIALWPLIPHQVQPLRAPNGDLVYKVNIAPEGMTADYRVLDKADILHTKLFGLNGLTGFSPIQMQRQLIGLSKASTRSAARLFKNSAVPTMALINKSPLPLSPEGKTMAREDFEKLTSGDNAHRLAILDSDWDLKLLGLNAEESQWIQSRGLSIEQICGLFRVPPHMVGAQQGRTTNSNMIEANSLFVSECLRSYMIKIQQQFISKLLNDAEKTQYELEFDTSPLLLGNLTDQSAYFSTAINGGWLTPAEVRHQLGLNPASEDSGLNVYRTPVNYMNAAVLLTQGSDDDPEPDEGADIVTGSAERSALKSYGMVYLPQFKAAVRSVVTKQSDLAQAFSPILDSIAEHIASGVGAEVDKERMVDYATKLAARSEKWTAESVDKIAADELRRAVKTFVFASYETRAKKELAA